MERKKFDGIVEDSIHIVVNYIVENLNKGDNVLLYGDLGAGKTTLIKKILSKLGFDENKILSPTFTLINEYEKNGLKVYHIDAYRINDDEAEYLDIQSLMENEDFIVFIEWPENIENYLSVFFKKIYISYSKGDIKKRDYILEGF